MEDDYITSGELKNFNHLTPKHQEEVKTKHPGGRPSEYTQDMADYICEQLALGSSLRTVCGAEGMPAMSTIFRWMRTNEEFCNQYARAKQESADAMAEDILDISDNGENDWMEKRYGNQDDSTWVVNGEALQRSRLRVDTRKWLMAKMKPKKYADNLKLSGDTENPLAVAITGMRIIEQNDGHESK